MIAYIPTIKRYCVLVAQLLAFSVILCLPISASFSPFAFFYCIICPSNDDSWLPVGYSFDWRYYRIPFLCNSTKTVLTVILSPLLAYRSRVNILCH